jgi:peroxiredoxin family protein
MGNTLNLIVLSGDYAKIHAAAMVTMVAGSLGQRVNIFVSMEAMTGFHRDDAVRSRLGRGPIGDLIVKSGGRDYREILEQAKEFGEVKIYACSLVLDLTGWTLPDLLPLFDDTMGLTAFLSMVGEGLSMVF